MAAVGSSQIYAVRLFPLWPKTGHRRKTLTQLQNMAWIRFIASVRRRRWFAVIPSGGRCLSANLLRGRAALTAITWSYLTVATELP